MPANPTQLEELARLADRCEAAEGPDRELDKAINRYLAEQGIFSAWGCDDPLRFTASLDAAFTLVPEGWAWEIGSNVGLHGAVVWQSDNDKPSAVLAATPALALCAAALRSISEEENA